MCKNVAAWSLNLNYFSELRTTTTQVPESTTLSTTETTTEEEVTEPSTTTVSKTTTKTTLKIATTSKNHVPEEEDTQHLSRNNRKPSPLTESKNQTKSSAAGKVYFQLVNLVFAVSFYFALN